ncbi:hypothetical protein Poli38472_004055 [Pythium oligandrum]|uniref:Uncharacterized protein n=1 Tax=Pythium oligandrum TaxID=41045 RepID=A0A8K1CPC8_PYTOL|nr:hypothetical protein Poli38472_004055 [Pythium oligandrum]|eukprot:TMW66290.1 hypothetical protein Poli38472_004055 [Pythium oligandrum]
MVYVDLNVRAASRVSTKELERLGYACVGVNVEVEGTAKPKEASLVMELPEEINEKNLNAKAAKKAKQYAAALANAMILKDDGVVKTTTGKTLRQLKRITLKVEDMNAAQAINSSPVLKTYDLVAVEAANAKVFQFLCEQGEVDLISFDVANRIPFQMKKTWVDAAIKRGIFFELTYSACLGDSAGRRYFFSNASNLVRITQGRQLVISSGSTRDLFLRSPYDVINIGILVGLTYGQAMDALTNAPLAVIEHAERRRGLGDLSVIASEPTPMEQ